MSANKYPSIFSRQMETIVYLYLRLTLYGNDADNVAQHKLYP